MDESHNFDACRAHMLRCLADQQSWRATAEQIEAEVTEQVRVHRAGHPDQHPEEYHVKAALAGHLGYELAVARRESARRRVTMWALAAQVEGLALTLADRTTT